MIYCWGCRAGIACHSDWCRDQQMDRAAEQDYWDQVEALYDPDQGWQDDYDNSVYGKG